MGLRGWVARLTGHRADAAGARADAVAFVSDVRSSDAEALLGRGNTLFEQGALVEAQQALAQALDLSHDLAPAHHALGRVQHEQGQLEEATDSLQLAVLFDSENAGAHADLALVLVQRSLRADAHAAVERAVGLSVDTARVWVVCARTYKALDEFERAAQCYEAAFAIDPGSAEIACQLGYVRFLHGDYAAARDAYARAFEIDPLHVSTWHNAGLLDLETGFPQQGLERFERAFALRESPQSLACIGHALRDLGRLSEACAAYERVLRAHPEFGDARINLSYALLMRGDFDAGWEQYDQRFQATRTRRRDFGLPQWRGEALEGRRLLIVAEQGLGDEIMFASCIPEAMSRSAGCVIECNTRLAALFARSFPQAHVHGGPKDGDCGWLSEIPACDFQIPVGGLPRYFRRTLDSFGRQRAYLKADPVRTELRRQELCVPGRLNIGFAWGGGTLRSRQWLRSIPLEQWLDLLRVPQCRFFALQHGEQALELDHFRSNEPIDVTDLSNVCADIDELAACVSALDLIISVDNTLVHLGGALGKPTWVLLPVASESRYPREGERMPWYSSVRLFRQTGPRDATVAMRQMKRKLQSEVVGVGRLQACEESACAQGTRN